MRQTIGKIVTYPILRKITFIIIFRRENIVYFYTCQYNKLTDTISKEGGFRMAPTTIMINNMLDTLDEEDYNTAISFIQFLSDSRKKKKAEQSQRILSEIQEMFSDDKGWPSENAMLNDMANFRKERMAK